MWLRQLGSVLQMPGSGQHWCCFWEAGLQSGVPVETQLRAGRWVLLGGRVYTRQGRSPGAPDQAGGRRVQSSFRQQLPNGSNVSRQSNYPASFIDSGICLQYVPNLGGTAEKCPNISRPKSG